MVNHFDHCLLLADFTIDGLAPFLASAAEPPTFDVTIAPFDQVVQLLLDESNGCWHPAPEVTLVWTRPNAAVKSFARLVEAESVSADVILAEVDEFVERLKVAAHRATALFVPTWTWPSYDRQLGVLNMSPKFGPAYHLLRMNARLAEALADVPNVYVLDAGRWVASAGLAAVNPKLWHLGKIAFGPDVFQQAAADVKAGLRAVRGQTRKLVVVDLDDTLWGGVVGEMGWEHLVLGGHHPVGEALSSFQRALKALGNRGMALGIVSKNSESTALEAIRRHPEMVLKIRDFAGWRINWRDKAENVAELAAELNLGLDSVVFIDDSPVERARVREALPQVLVPDWPSDKLLYEQALAQLRCFDALTISPEDQSRSRMYDSERKRQAARSMSQSVEEYLHSLGLRVSVEPLGAANVQRTVQLLNKTNQMNLATRRLSEAQFVAWAATEGRQVFLFRVADRFDDYGLTAIGSLDVDGDSARVADFVMSCRVIGRGVEQTLLHLLAEQARATGAKQLVAEFIPTARNAACKQFLDERSGLTCESGTNRYRWQLAAPYPAPGHIAVERATEPSVATVVVPQPL